MSDRLCIIAGCHQYNAHWDDCLADRCKGCLPRYVEQGLVCNPDRAGIGETLAELATLWRELEQLPLTGLGRQGQAVQVSGSREAPVPISLDLLDLTADARNGSVIVRRDTDQTGHLAAPTELDVWVRDWRKRRNLSEHLPPMPTVYQLVKWLTNRLDWACNHHEKIDEFASEIGRLRKTLRRTLQLDTVTRESCKGVACKSCDRMALYREDGLVTCGYCKLNYSEKEYRDWVKLEAPYALGLVRDGEVEPENPEELARLLAGKARRMAA